MMNFIMFAPDMVNVWDCYILSPAVWGWQGLVQTSGATVLLKVRRCPWIRRVEHEGRAGQPDPTRPQLFLVTVKYISSHDLVSSSFYQWIRYFFFSVGNNNWNCHVAQELHLHLSQWEQGHPTPTFTRTDHCYDGISGRCDPCMLHNKRQ